MTTNMQRQVFEAGAIQKISNICVLCLLVCCLRWLCYCQYASDINLELAIACVVLLASFEREIDQALKTHHP